ncbi:MAG: 3-deoxy-manno-octulosonate cytidylyltransferase [Bacteroidia bacterium]|nr:3-deoxy-manno-octulosonate cytidylyltransferase [Bacteroidia bacterium]
MKIAGIIPARYASSRFPGKPLIEIKGKTMIRRVYEQAVKAKALSDVIVATDDRRIYEHVLEFGKAVMTSSKHLTGTDRLAEVIRKWKGTRPAGVINIQGDEPFIQPGQIDLLAGILEKRNTAIATLAIPLKERGDIHNASAIKVVMDKEGYALYFSRAPIPFVRAEGSERTGYFRHVGIYGYRSSVLLKLASLAPGKLERLESLEQLRWMENGYRIRVGITRHSSFSIDTPADLRKISGIL